MKESAETLPGFLQKLSKPDVLIQLSTPPVSLFNAKVFYSE